MHLYGLFVNDNLAKITVLYCYRFFDENTYIYIYFIIFIVIVILIHQFHHLLEKVDINTPEKNTPILEC